MLPVVYYPLSSVISPLPNLRRFALFESFYQPVFHWRWLKNKGASLVLFWSFVVFLITNLFLNSFLYDKDQHLSFWVKFIAVIVTLVFPMFGLLADIYFSRYKVIKVCMMVLWVGAVLLSISSMEVLGPTAASALKTLAFLLGCFGISGFQVSVIQFLIDQLLDSSSSEILFFARVYVWLVYVSDVVCKVAYILQFSKEYTRKYSSIFPLLLTVLLTLAVSSDFLFSHWLVKEPVSHNPLKLIFRVLKYAIQNSHPRQRSAFTYCDNKPYTRIDLGKHKYGGPFTTEQVEDVKTFFRILNIVVIITSVLGLIANIGHVSEASFSFNFKDYVECTFKSCFWRFLPGSGSAIVAISFPVWELCIRPLLQKLFMCKVKILGQLTFGMLLLILYISSLMIFELVGESRWHRSNQDQDLSCALMHNGTQSAMNDYGIFIGWLVIPSIVSAVGINWIIAGMIEFIAAQSPYSMKGLLFGIIYFCSLLSAVIFYYFSIFFHSQTFNSIGNFGCVFWFLLASLTLAQLFLVGFLFSCCCYKNRQREDNLPNQHCFAESYYERRIASSSRSTESV